MVLKPLHLVYQYCPNSKYYSDNCNVVQISLNHCDKNLILLLHCSHLLYPISNVVLPSASLPNLRQLVDDALAVADIDTNAFDSATYTVIDITFL